MNDLVIGPDWEQQITRLRDALTEDSNIIRWGNDFYRCCRDGEPVTLLLHTHDDAQALKLQMRPRDLYITQIAGHMDMGRYGSLTGAGRVDGERLSHAVHALSRGRVHGDEAFELRSLVVFCVAESLRFDGLARDIGYTMLVGQNKVLGTETPLPIKRWWPVVHGWGQACDAVWAGLKPEVRQAALHQPRAGLDVTRRRLFERAGYEHMPAANRAIAQAAKALKRPG
ncbi:MAG: hypothetical protein QM750_21195 [Rubrivivax sp.]